MLDKLAMITMLILMILVGLISLFTYIATINENRPEWERQRDDEEQMKFLKEYNNRRKKIERKDNSQRWYILC